MKLQDALFNWLQMHIVVQGRPDDRAAQETLEFFAEILREDHALRFVQIVQVDDRSIHIGYEEEGISKKQQFDRESAEKLLEDIRSNPKYN